MVLVLLAHCQALHLTIMNNIIYISYPDNSEFCFWCSSIVAWVSLIQFFHREKCLRFSVFMLYYSEIVHFPPALFFMDTQTYICVMISEQELEQVRRLNQQKEEELLRRHAVERKTLPKRQRQEMKVRSLMFKESLRISNQGSYPDDDRSKIKHVSLFFENITILRNIIPSVNVRLKICKLLNERICIYCNLYTVANTWLPIKC